MLDKSIIMTKATLLRKRFGEDGESPIDVFSIAQNIENLTLVFYRMSENLSGMCIKSADNVAANVIAINSAMTAGRQRFSIAHELYHLYYDKQMSSICSKKINGAKGVEREADCFASFFLMPSAALQSMIDQMLDKRSVRKLTLCDVIRLEQFFRVSHQAMAYRLEEDGYFTSDEANELMQQRVRRIAERMGFNTDLYRSAPENRQYCTYGHYLVQAEQVLRKELISEGKYEELLLDAFRADLVYGIDDEGGELLD